MNEKTARDLLLSCRSKFEIDEIRKNVGKCIKDPYISSYFFQLSADCLRYIEALEKAGIHANNIEQASKLIKAEAEGRLMMLPCKVGDMVYEPRPDRGFISSYEITQIRFYKYDYIFADWKCIDGIYRNLNGFNLSALGKTIFLTREEAEAALKGE